MNLRLLVATSLTIATALGVAWYNSPGLRSPFTSPKKISPLAFKMREVSMQTRTNTRNRIDDNFAPKLSNLKPYLSFIGASVAVADIDNDGWQDIFLPNSDSLFHNKILKNLGDGTFSDVSLGSGIEKNDNEWTPNLAIFFDLNNNGFKDLLLVSNKCVKLFKNNGNFQFQEISASSGVNDCTYSYAANVIDYDNDGYLDIVIGSFFKDGDFYSPKTTHFMPNSVVNANNGGRLLIYHNNGDETFKLISNNLGIKNHEWSQSIFVYDFDQDLLPDLWFTRGRNKDSIFLNQDGKYFSSNSAQIPDNGPRFGMGIDVADAFNDGRTFIYVGHIFLPALKSNGNAFWETNGLTDKLVNRSREEKINNCGWTWGVKFIDFDNNGVLDLYATNGFVSQNKDSEYWYDLVNIGSGGRDIMANSLNWPPMEDKSWGGYQRDCIYLNTGEKFIDITNSTPIKHDNLDGRGVATIDYKNNGSQSLIVVNQKQELRFYEFKQNNDNSWIGFQLTGNSSNRDALGSQVKVTLSDGTTLIRYHYPTNGFVSQSDSRVHFGIGTKREISTITVAWPSGKKSVIKDYKINQYNLVKEPI